MIKTIKLTDEQISTMAQHASDDLNLSGWDHLDPLTFTNGDTSVTKNLETEFLMNAPMPHSIRKALAGDDYPELHCELLVATKMSIVLDDVVFNENDNLWKWTGADYSFTTVDGRTDYYVAVCLVVGFDDERSTSPDYQYFDVHIDEESKQSLVQAIQKLMKERQYYSVVIEGVNGLLKRRKERCELLAKPQPEPF